MKKIITTLLLCFSAVYLFAFNFELNGSIGYDTFKGKTRDILNYWDDPEDIKNVEYSRNGISYNIGLSGHTKFGLVTLYDFTYMPADNMINPCLELTVYDYDFDDEDYFEYLDEPYELHFTKKMLDNFLGDSKGLRLYGIYRHNIGLGYCFKLNNKSELTVGLSYLRSSYMFGAFNLFKTNYQVFSYGNEGIEALLRYSYRIKNKIKLFADIKADFNINDFTKLEYDNLSVYSASYINKDKSDNIFSGINVKVGLVYQFKDWPKFKPRKAK